MHLHQINFKNIYTNGGYAHNDQFVLSLFNNSSCLLAYTVGFLLYFKQEDFSFPNYLLFPSYSRFLTPLQQTAFWKHSDNRWNCSNREISPFATIFSTFSHRLSIQYFLTKYVQSCLLQNCWLRCICYTGKRSKCSW